MVLFEASIISFFLRGGLISKKNIEGKVFPFNVVHVVTDRTDQHQILS